MRHGSKRERISLVSSSGVVSEYQMVAPRIWLFPDMNQAESRVVAWRGPVPKLRQWYIEGQDVHLKMTHLIAKAIQESKIPIPKRGGIALFTRKPWDEFIKGDEEREQTKRIVHGGNYEIGGKKTALILGVSEVLARILLAIYYSLNPEIKNNYHAWIRAELKRTRTLWMPNPVRFRKVFWDILDDDTYRQGYASYPQCIVAAMLNRTLVHCANIFRKDSNELLKDQWCAWYGVENWDHWRSLRDVNDRSPQAILWSGMDIRLNVHDAGGISAPSDPDLVRWAVVTWRGKAEEQIWITENDPLVIPVDFKTGSSWGELEDYKIA